MSETTVGQRLKFLIKQLNLDVKGFCKALDVSETTVRNYFNRGSNPNAEFLMKLTNTFGLVNLGWLLTGKGEHFLSESTQSSTLQQTNIKNNSGIGISNGSTNNITNNLTLDDCKQSLQQSERENAHLREQLARADALVAAKDETINLLRASYNRPN